MIVAVRFVRSAFRKQLPLKNTGTSATVPAPRVLDEFIALAEKLFGDPAEAHGEFP